MRAARAWCVAVALVAATAVVTADDHSVIFDEDIDFSIFKTFSIREARVASDRPELTFPAVAKSIDEAIRTSLAGFSMKEAGDRSDLIAECTVSGKDFDIGPWGRPSSVPPGGRGRRGGMLAEIDFTEVTMVLDLKRRDSGELVFRGVYHDSEEDVAKLVKALPRDVATLLSKYPLKKRVAE